MTKLIGGFMQIAFAEKKAVSCVGGATQRSPALLLFQSIAHILERDPSRRAVTLRCRTDVRQTTPVCENLAVPFG